MYDQQSLRSASAYAQTDQSLRLSLEYSMNVELLTEHHLEFLTFKGGFTGSSESTLVKMPHCWKSHVVAHNILGYTRTSCTTETLTWLSIHPRVNLVWLPWPFLSVWHFYKHTNNHKRVICKLLYVQFTINLFVHWLFSSNNGNI